ncbi:MAG TPA: cardiolipin synthase [bacterium]|nr:cardiolipin synthase [bacterium]HNT66214.1 cardiolipin synthase [bacterium]HOX85383.1 cardiolipin synthase [bacterium]HPG44542.1 cardiolipin synthase [bacterium]HPM97100.1 cardiolipin synthase [bacterium]
MWATINNHIFITLYILSLFFIPYIITQKKNPVSALAWIMATVLLPLVGPLFYLFFGTNRIRNRGLAKLFSNTRMRKKLREIESRSEPDTTIERFLQADSAMADIIKICKKFSFFDAVADNQLELLIDPEATYQRLEEIIAEAKHEIAINFYIFEADRIGMHFLTLLQEKVKAGVAVYFLYDAIGSRRLGFRRRLLRDLRRAGIQVSEFLALRNFFKLWNLNLRNHRKIVVVDGQTAVVGSLNIGAEFLSNDKESWRETSVLVKGPAAAQLRWVFSEDWYTATGQVLAAPQLGKHIKYGNSVAQVVASGPDERGQAVYHAFIMALATAQKTVYLTTPYFIPDHAFELALKLAALRDVDVRLLAPGRSDHPFVRLAGRSYYNDLLENGVQIYEYNGGILHAKMMTVDGLLTIIGSANTDIRSFRYNFEVNLQVYDHDFACQAEQVFFRDLQQSHRLGEKFLQRSAPARFGENVFRLTSPLL